MKEHPSPEATRAMIQQWLDAQPPPRPPQRWRGPMGDLTRLMLERKVLTLRRFDDRGGPWLQEVEHAKKLAQPWIDCLLTEIREVGAWLDLHPGIAAHVAANLRDAGISPQDAALRLWYGKERGDRQTIAQQVQAWKITAKEAAVAVRTFRRGGGGS